MWKKFLASMAIVGLMSGTVAFAAPYSEVDSPVTSISATPYVVTPGQDYSQVSYTLSEDAQIYAYVVDNAGNLETVVSNFVSQTAGTHSITWYATENNQPDGTPLPEDIYIMRVWAYVGGTVEGYGFHAIEVTGAQTVPAPEVSNLTVNPGTFTPEDGETVQIAFSTDQQSNLTIRVQDGNGQTVRTFSSFNGDTWLYGPKNQDWDGRTNSGTYADPGTYTVQVTASNTNGVDTETTTVVVTAAQVVQAPSVYNLDLNQTQFSPEDGESTLVSFYTDQDAYVTAVVKDGSSIIKNFNLFDGDYLADGYHSLVWNGTNDAGNNVNGGTYTVQVTASNTNGMDTETTTVVVEDQSNVDSPVITELKVSTYEFQPEDGERTKISFDVSEDSYVTIRIMDGNTTIRTFNSYYNDWHDSGYQSIYWDGRDDDGDTVSNDVYKVRVTASNSDGSDTDEVNVSVDSNVSGSDIIDNLETDPDSYWNPDDEKLDISFELTEGVTNLKVWVEEVNGNDEYDIYDEYTADDVDYHLYWDGELDFGNEADEGKWKLFVEADGDVVSKYIDIDYDYNGGHHDGYYDEDCGYYYDDLEYLDSDNELCKAITWATEENIFDGYPDGLFRPYQNINRAEVLKVVLEAFDNVSILHENASNAGFWDVDPLAWYMPYVRTAQFYNMLDGYPDGSARLGNPINRVEFLKFVLEASESFSSYEFVNTPVDYFYADVDPYDSNEAWFYDYAATSYIYKLYNTEIVDGQEFLRPAKMVERGEVALLLYRMDQAGLMN